MGMILVMQPTYADKLTGDASKEEGLPQLLRGTKPKSIERSIDRLFKNQARLIEVLYKKNLINRADLGEILNLGGDMEVIAVRQPFGDPE